MRKRKPILYVCIFTVLTMVMTVFFTSPAIAGSIKNSKHNLSSGGLGDLKSTDTSMICIFCHTTHTGSAAAPMWNRQEGAPLYTLYDSSTLQSIPGQPDGPSKLCLSCHDGTIALGKVLKGKGALDVISPSLGRIPPGRRANLGSDLSDDHPISFITTAAVNLSTELRHPVSGDPVKYDGAGKIQCTTCHDPHNNMYGDFLVKDNHNSLICKTCHDPRGYSGISTHDTAPNSWDGSHKNPWPFTNFTTVTGNSCMNCHHSHGAEGKHRLLSSNIEEDVCTVCHNGTVGKNIESVLRKPSKHRVNFYRGVHDPAENMLNAAKHVECADCHNPHQTRGTTAAAPNVNGRLAGVSGMTITGSPIATAQYEYQICLKCHGQDRYQVPTSINRQVRHDNLRTAFNPSNASYHAVAGQGKSSYVPSLKPPYTVSSRLYCGDCHNNDNRSGPRGPHGSRWDFLLEKRYEIADYTNWSEAFYALCFKCHDPNLLMNGNVSGFEEHDKHVRGENTPCSVCHDPHGSVNAPGLINFDTNVVFPNTNGQLRFEVIGDRGYCYLNCHGEDHGPEDYRRK